VRTPLFRDRPTLAPPASGPLLGERALIVCAPVDADVAGALRLGRRLRALGVTVEAASECHGEVRGERRRILMPNRLLVDARADEWDALVFAGGAGAARVAEDPLARELAGVVAAAGCVVAAFGAGAAVLARAGVRGVVRAGADELADALVGSAKSLNPRQSTQPVDVQ
jgi:hypothetical protein